MKEGEARLTAAGWLLSRCSTLAAWFWLKVANNKRREDVVPAAHLLPDGLQVFVSDDVLPELDPGQPGAPGVGEELEEALLWLKAVVGVDQLHVPAQAGGSTSAQTCKPASRNQFPRPVTYVLTSLSQISLGRKMSERRDSLFLKPGQHMVFLRFLRQKTVARVIRLSGLSPNGAAMLLRLRSKRGTEGTLAVQKEKD